MKYDIEICLPVITNDQRYRKRLDEFKKIGLLNYRGHRVKLVVLVSGEDDARWAGSHWPPGLDVTVMKCPHWSVISKLTHYYMSLNRLESNWYGCVDDDSVTDIATLMPYLNKIDSDDPIYLATCLHTEIRAEGEEFPALHACGYAVYDWCHEWESRFLNRHAIMRLLSNEPIRNYIRIRGQHIGGYGDHFIAHAAKMVGIKIQNCEISSHLPESEKMAIFGGNLAHVHFVSHDHHNNAVFFQWLTRGISPTCE
jgi:hypothetical protein